MVKLEFAYIILSMHKVLKIILAVFIVASVEGSLVSAVSYVNQTDIDVIAASNKAYSDFIEVINDEKSVANGAALAQAAAASSAFNNVASHTFSSKLGIKYVKKSAEVKKCAGEIKVLLDKIAVVLRERDYNAANQYLAQTRNSVKKYSAAVEEVNKAASESNLYAGCLFLLTTIAAAAMVIGSFIWFAIGRSKRLNHSLLEARKAVALSSLTPLAGAVILYTTFILTVSTNSADGIYIVANVLILIGLASYVSSIIKYIKLNDNTPTALPAHSTTKNRR